MAQHSKSSIDQKCFLNSRILFDRHCKSCLSKQFLLLIWQSAALLYTLLTMMTRILENNPDF